MSEGDPFENPKYEIPDGESVAASEEGENKVLYRVKVRKVRYVSEAEKESSMSIAAFSLLAEARKISNRSGKSLKWTDQERSALSGALHTALKKPNLQSYLESEDLNTRFSLVHRAFRDALELYTTGSEREIQDYSAQKAGLKQREGGEWIVWSSKDSLAAGSLEHIELTFLDEKESPGSRKSKRVEVSDEDRGGVYVSEEELL